MSWVTPGHVVVAAVGGFFLIAAARRFVLRPRPVTPAAATPELGDESPALVNLLTHRMNAPAAASATLLDLAARRVVELSEVGPGRTLVRIRGQLPSDARPYEIRVLDRVRRVAGSNLVPVEELTRRYAADGERWHRRLTHEVARDARRLGLTRSTASELSIPALVAAAVAAGAIVAKLAKLLAGRPDSADSGPGGPLAALIGWGWLTLLLYLALELSVGVLFPEQDRLTSRGRQVAAHWLGVASWLRAHEPLRDLPPAAVAVWDRYLAYGAALGVMRHAVEVLDLETTGRRDVVWSQHTGVRRPVQVRYPKRSRLLRPLGRVPAGARLLWAVISLPGWSLLAVTALRWSAGHRWPALVVVAVAVVQAARALYRLVRSTVDLRWPARVTGTLIDISVTGQTSVSADHPELPATVPTHYHLIVDDGSTDQQRPWIANRDLVGGRRARAGSADRADLSSRLAQAMLVDFSIGDGVYLEGQRWSRYVAVLRHARRPTD